MLDARRTHALTNTKVILYNKLCEIVLRRDVVNLLFSLL